MSIIAVADNGRQANNAGGEGRTQERRKRQRRVV